MNLAELDRLYKQEVDILGNQLQNTLLALSQAELRIIEMGNSLQNLNRIVEEFIQQQQEE